MLILGIVAIGLVVVVLLAVLRTAWRIWRHNEQLEPGGSYGRQSFGRYRDPNIDDAGPERPEQGATGDSR